MDVELPPPIPNVEDVVASREVFTSFIYTPWREALEELEKRQSDEVLAQYMRTSLPNDIPPIMQGKKNMVLFRHIATPNYEIRRFLAVADSLTELTPLILEYAGDKFNDRNLPKYFLGKLCFQKGLNKKGEAIWESTRVIDFNSSNNMPISAVNTVWGESLVQFHHDLFFKTFPNLTHNVSDISEWLKAIGPAAKDYYKAFFSLFLRDGILFENFFLDEKELAFTKNVIIPSMLDIMRETGKKPLIVTLAPSEIEEDAFWHSYPHSEKVAMLAKLQNTDTV